MPGGCEAEAGFVSAVTAEALDYYGGYWGFGSYAGADALVLAYGSGAAVDPVTYTFIITDFAWDRTTGAFSFDYSFSDYMDYGDGGAPPPAVDRFGLAAEGVLD
jgi:hypothetical protein